MSGEIDLSQEAGVPVGAKGKHAARNALIALVLLALIAFGIWKFTGPSTGGGTAGGQSSKGRPPTTVGVTQVERADMPVTITEIGTVQPVVNATVRAQLAGVLEKIYFTEGQHVTKGQVLAQVDPRPYEAQLEQSQGTLAKDQANLNLARVDLKRYQTLLAQDSIASQQVDTQAALVKQLEGTMTTDQGAVRNAHVNLGYTTVRAPVTGKIGLRQVDIGSYVAPGDANGIVAVTVTDPIDVEFSLPQNQIAQVQAAVHSLAGLPVTILDQANTTALAHGFFHAFDNVIDATSGTVKAKARVANGGEALFPNEFVNVQLLVDTVHNAMVVPVSAVRTGPTGPFVYVMTPDRIAHRVAVTTGPSDSARQVITSGLSGNETIIYEGADRIDDGSKVAAAAGVFAGGHGPQQQNRGQNVAPAGLPPAGAGANRLHGGRHHQQTDAGGVSQ
ncbi:MAG: efflux RND transporter periplasmic adaptor subunit [Alphaproteobacteria bacterium]|nr:efflux RND transporter periplasmic adaptor subunit [Alphaproteobacteria bacterium]MDE2341617.1 efflux RND transporter periplasmic adaptor subunit [Alphaproteobacteria bacterium]